jgi:hypothetical protein
LLPLLRRRSMQTVILQCESSPSLWELWFQRSVGIWPKSWEWNAISCVRCRICWWLLKKWFVSNWRNACYGRSQNTNAAIFISCLQVTSHDCFTPTIIGNVGRILE